MRKADLDAWAERNMVNAEDLELLMDEEAQIQAVSSPLARTLDPHILSFSGWTTRTLQHTSARA